MTIQSASISEKAEIFLRILAAGLMVGALIVLPSIEIVLAALG